MSAPFRGFAVLGKTAQPVFKTVNGIPVLGAGNIESIGTPGSNAIIFEYNSETDTQTGTWETFGPTLFSEIELIRLRKHDLLGNDIAAWTAGITVGSIVKFQRQDDPTQYGIYQVSSIQNQTGPARYMIGVTFIGGGGEVGSEGEKTAVSWSQIGPQGRQGSQGEIIGLTGLSGSNAIEFRYAEETDATTGSYETFYESDFTAVAVFRFRTDNIAGDNILDWVHSLNTGYILKIQRVDAPENFGIYRVTGQQIQNGPPARLLIDVVLIAGNGTTGSVGTVSAVSWVPMGNQGAQGNAGFQGRQGAQGTGVQGFQGNVGATGATGATGFQGLVGNTGAVGSQGSGVQGNSGFQGIRGTQGNQGWQGNMGVTGATGIQGYQGVGATISSAYMATNYAGLIYTPYVPFNKTVYSSKKYRVKVFGNVSVGIINTYKIISISHPGGHVSGSYLSFRDEYNQSFAYKHYNGTDLTVDWSTGFIQEVTSENYFELNFIYTCTTNGTLTFSFQQQAGSTSWKAGTTVVIDEY